VTTGIHGPPGGPQEALPFLAISMNYNELRSKVRTLTIQSSLQSSLESSLESLNNKFTIFQSKSITYNLATPADGDDDSICDCCSHL